MNRNTVWYSGFLLLKTKKAFSIMNMMKKASDRKKIRKSCNEYDENS